MRKAARRATREAAREAAREAQAPKTRPVWRVPQVRVPWIPRVLRMPPVP
jgi:hypothetical protein